MSLHVNILAHVEGHTSLSFDDDGKNIATCGSDGRLRIWEAPSYDVITTHPIGEKAFAVHIRKSHIYVSNDNNGIPAMTFPFLEPEGYLSFFSAPVTHVVSNKDGTIVCAGSCDFTVRIINVKDRTFKDLKHMAPVLSVDLDPKEEFLLSSSCDGSVCVWSLSTNTSVKSWEGIIPKSNAFENSKVLCRIAWEPLTGTYLAIPTGNVISVYQRNTWELLYTLEDDRIDSDLSVCAISPNGLYLVAGSSNGLTIIWNISSRKCTEFIQNNKKVAITGLAWNPKKREELACCDYDGQLNVYNISSATDENFLTEDDVIASFNEPFEDDSDNENSFSISKIKAETVGLPDDENNTNDDPTLSAKRDQIKSGISSITNENAAETKTVEEDGYDTDVMSVASEHYSQKPSNWDFKKNFQSSFQPGSTPSHLSHRFMMWNSIGIIISHNTEEENSIDIEFHDSAVHHAMHLNNNSNHIMAAMSTEAVILANESEEDTPSGLLCMHFGSWDSCKEWSVHMPSKENIQAIAIGDGWVAVATNQRQLRMFTIGGVQLEAISLPGPVVCMSGHEDRLIVSYHFGAGFPGDQNLAVIVLFVLARKMIFFNVPLPLSPQSTLMWLGFTDEGTPTCVDSNGIVRLLRHNFGNVWAQVCDTRADVKGKSDHFFVVGLSEIQESIRCIPCKGARYPPTLPRPVMSVISMKLPMCEMNTEKSQLEESIWRHKLVNDTLQSLENSSYEIDQQMKESTSKALQATLMKAFALACRSDRELRAAEICELMPSSYNVQLAIKYASSQKHLKLAQILSQTAFQKNEEENQRLLKRDAVLADDEASVPELKKRCIETETKVSTRSSSKMHDSEEVFSDDDCEVEEILEDENEKAMTEKSVEPSSNGGKKNPFKKKTISPRKSIESGKGTEVFDSFKNTKGKRKENPKSKRVSQSTLFTPQTARRGSRNSSGSVATNKKFKSWFELYKEELKSENPHLNDKQLKKFAVDLFEKTDDAEKQKWEEKVSKGNISQSAKRKSNDDQEDDQSTLQKNKKANNSITGKLTDFMFTREK